MINNESIKEELPNKSTLAITYKKENNTNINSLDADLIKKAKSYTTSGEIDLLIFNICKENKAFLTDLNTFNNYFKNCYEHVKIKPFHMKYIFYKYKSKCFNLNLEDILEYCNSDETLGYFYRDSSYRLLIGTDGKLFKHTHLIFFTEENIKRLINSEHILIDCRSLSDIDNNVL